MDNNLFLNETKVSMLNEDYGRGSNMYRPTQFGPGDGMLYWYL